MEQEKVLYSCAILPQPDWHNDEEFTQSGEPRLGFLVSAGNIDSMVNHYSAWESAWLYWPSQWYLTW